MRVKENTQNKQNSSISQIIYGGFLRFAMPKGRKDEDEEKTHQKMIVVYDFCM